MKYAEIECAYMVYGKEVGESGTKHLQGFVKFNGQKTMSAAIKTLVGSHVSVARDVDASIAYCKKDGAVVERGSAPVSAARAGKVGGDLEKERWATALSLAKEGRIEEIDPQIQISHVRNLDYIATRENLKRKVEEISSLENVWYYGPSGGGKSVKARQEFPDPYDKNCNKWWCGYEGQDSVLLDDFDKVHHVLGHHLKRWADHYPFQAEVKGGSKKIRPLHIVVTSNWSPSEIWQDSNSLEPILRRFRLEYVPAQVEVTPNPTAFVPGFVPKTQ